MAERQQDIEALKRRGRRRLVGAVALVLAAVIVLPMVFDPEPRSGAPAVSVRIPGENEAPFKPKPVPKPAPKAEAPAEKKAAPPPETPPAAKAAPAKPAAAKPAPAAKAAKAEQARAEAALAGTEYEFQVGVFSDPTYAIDKLKEAKLKYYTEAVNNLTRVRAGPFATKEAAEKARERLKALGLEPGTVVSKSG